MDQHRYQPDRRYTSRIFTSSTRRSTGRIAHGGDFLLKAVEPLEKKLEDDFNNEPFEWGQPPSPSPPPSEVSPKSMTDKPSDVEAEEQEFQNSTAEEHEFQNSTAESLVVSDKPSQEEKEKENEAQSSTSGEYAFAEEDQYLIRGRGRGRGHLRGRGPGRAFDRRENGRGMGRFPGRDLGRGPGRGFGRGPGRGRGPERPIQTCYNCGRPGHISRDCIQQNEGDRRPRAPNNNNNSQMKVKPQEKDKEEALE